MDERTWLTKEDGKTSREKETPSPSLGASSFSREQKVLLACLCSGSLLAGSLMAVMIPFFPLEAAERGVSQMVIGGAFSCFAATQIAVYPLSGWFVPRAGVSFSYCTGMTIAALSTAVFGALPLIPNTDVFILASFITRMVEAIAVCLVNTAVLTIVASRFADRTITAISVIETSAGLGISLGPGVGGLLYYVGGYGLPFYVISVLMLLAGGMAYRVMPPVGEMTTEKESCWPLLWMFAGSAEAGLCCLVLLSVSMNWSFVAPNIEPYAFSAIGTTPSQLGLYFLVATGSFTVCCYLWGMLHGRINNNFVLITPCLLGCSAGLMLMSPSPLLPLQPCWWLLGLGMVIREVCQAGSYIPLFPKMLRAGLARGMPNTTVSQSFVSSVFWTVFSVGNVVGPTVGGAIVDATSFPTMTTVLAGWMFLTACCSAVQAVRVWRAET